MYQLARIIEILLLLVVLLLYLFLQLLLGDETGFPLHQRIGDDNVENAPVVHDIDRRPVLQDIFRAPDIRFQSADEYAGFAQIRDESKGDPFCEVFIEKVDDPHAQPDRQAQNAGDHDKQ